MVIAVGREDLVSVCVEADLKKPLTEDTHDAQGCPICFSFHEASSFPESAPEVPEQSLAVMLLHQQMTADTTELSTTD